nr:hypothetical protein [Flavihumibacter rivuli]
MALQQLLPLSAMALTSGPTQPESKAFQQAGVSDMVDLFSGDFKYNIPLMDVDGYPINLNYQSGVGMDDEASWVGLGWNLNVGAINRQLRGIPDDFNGADKVLTEHYTKPKITVGGRVTAKVEIKGKAGSKAGGSGSFSLGVFNDNYNGIGAEIGFNAGLSFSATNSGLMTMGLGLGVNSNTSSGVDVNPSLSLSARIHASANTTVVPGISGSLGYNTRAGLKELTLASSFSLSGQDGDKKWGYDLGQSGSTISYNTDPLMPRIQIPYRTSNGNFSFDVGGAAWLIFAGGGGTGYRTVREVKSRFMSNPAFGFLYADRGKNQPQAMMDFIREKENPITPDLPNLAVPVHTPDLFTYTNQKASGQFRLYRGGTGVLFDNQAVDESTSKSLGFDAGFGAFGHGGVTYNEQMVRSATRKWTRDNDYNSKADFQSPDDPRNDAVFFKQVGEKNLEDANMVSALRAEAPIAVGITGKRALSSFVSNSRQNATISSSITKTGKQVKRSSVSYLTAAEAQKQYAAIKTFPFNDKSNFAIPGCHQPSAAEQVARWDLQVRKAHHIGTVNVTGDDGSRMEYGLPVYNVKQEEYSFAVKPNYNDASVRDKNIVFPNWVNTFPYQLYRSNLNTDLKSTDHYFHKETTPAYATSFLLTAIYSPDYVDVTGDGITEDDLGTAIKFNYSKLPSTYKWRSPLKGAILNKGLLADPDDDKASFVYGEKEIWYLHSIETKTKIAYFITQDRADALGVNDVRGQSLNTSLKQKALKEIRLYSKADVTKPIKTVVLEHSYSLCRNVENFDNAVNDPHKGKLTLEKVYFTYGNSKKGSHFPYVFKYNNTGQEGTQYPDVVNFDYLSADRWGTYKPRLANQGSTAFSGFRNDEFPYVLQDNAANADQWAATWLLSKIELPSGGEISVDYEADRYTYVQDKRAMKMIRITGLINSGTGTTNDLNSATGVVLDMPYPTGVPGDLLVWFKKNYLNSSDYLYSRAFINVSDDPQSSNEALYDNVASYSRVVGIVNVSGKLGVKLEMINNSGVQVTPIIHSAWQKMRMEYPRYAYPGYRNRVSDESASKALEAAIGAIVNSAKNLGELKENFNKKAKRKGFCSKVILEKSFAKIAIGPQESKYGGGSRVKKIRISDKWQTMVGAQNGITSSYGQEYAYTDALSGTGNAVSTGVASYEPSVGGDENPMRLPIPYTEKIKGAINNYFNMEEPFGEYLFPSASVGYSKVTVRALNANGEVDLANQTGYTVSEFFTAREFPVITKRTPLLKVNKGPTKNFNPISGNAIHESIFSQGYSIELNDMHGKARAEKTYNSSGALIASVEYEYATSPLNTGQYKLRNTVSVFKEDGSIAPNQIIGREIEMFADMREQETINEGMAIHFGFDLIPFPLSGTLPVPHFPGKINSEYRLFRSAATIKVVQYYGFPVKVHKMQDGATISVENILYDGTTGEALLTKTINEFKKPVYSFNLPAYFVESYMGGAYRNLGSIVSFSTNSTGVVSSPYLGVLFPGDELVDEQGTRLWMVKTSEAQTDYNPSIGVLRTVDRSGNLVKNYNGKARIIRSAYRNQLLPSATFIVTLENPIVNNNLQLLSNVSLKKFKVLSANATEYAQTWGQPVTCATCPPGYTLSQDGTRCEQNSIQNTSQCFTFCKGGFNSAYGIEGALIQESTSSPLVNVKSNYWGGDCFIAQAITGFTDAKATSPKINNKPVIKEEKPAQDSVKKLMDKQLEDKVNQGKANADDIQSVALPSTACTRYDYTSTSTPTGSCGPLVRAGVWLCLGTTNYAGYPLREWFGFEKCINFPETKTYYIGYAVDNRMKIYIDGQLWKSLDTYNQSTFKYWYVSPITLTAEKHTIRVEMYNDDGPSTMALEVYNNTYDQLLNANFNTSVLFSTNDIINSDTYSFRTINGVEVPRYTCANGSKPDLCNGNKCTINVNQVRNPYVTGDLGNWRPKEAKVYQVSRKSEEDFNPGGKGLDLSNGGYFTDFIPYHYRSASTGSWGKNNSHQNWVTASTVTMVDKYGQELENRDALGRFSAAKFAFRGSLPAVVSSNAYHGDIAYNSFEDEGFRSGCLTDTDAACASKQWVLTDGNNPNLSGYLNSSKAHTGKYSLQLPSNGLTLSTQYGIKDVSKTTLSTNTNGEFIRTPGKGYFAEGFNPTPGKKFMVSLWVKDASAANNVPVQFIVNDQYSQPVLLKVKAVVEGWKLIEGELNNLESYGTASQLKFMLRPSTGNVLIDDLRIHPYDSQVKTYAYDEQSLRLMAELDENNFASFYEYDDEGSLVRVKKETEKGIITIKETRSSYRKN